MAWDKSKIPSDVKPKDIETDIILLIMDIKNDFYVFLHRPIKSVEGLENLYSLG